MKEGENILNKAMHVNELLCYEIVITGCLLKNALAELSSRTQAEQRKEIN